VIWFKHYSDSSKGNTLNILMDKFGHFGYAGYFILVEMCAEKFTLSMRRNGDTTFRFSMREVRQRLRANSAKVEAILNLCSASGQLHFNINSTLVEIDFHKLLEYMDKDTKYHSSLRYHSDFRATLEKEKDIEIDINKNKYIKRPIPVDVLHTPKKDQKNDPPLPSEERRPASPVLDCLVGIEDDFFSRMTLQAQESWVKEFGLEFLKLHVTHFYSAWLTDQPHDDHTVRLRPLTMWVRNCLSRERKFSNRQKSGLEQWMDEQKQKKALK